MKALLSQARERYLRNRAFKLVLLSSLIIGGLTIKTQTQKANDTSIRLGYSFFGSIDEIDPIEINSIYHSNILENLYSRLIEYDNAGQIVCSLCSSFQIDKNIIYFNFASYTRSIEGKSVGPMDAKICLERIAASQSNTHGSLSYYLVPASAEPIQVRENQLIIRVARPEWVPFVLSLLSSMDFSIIPKDSLDLRSNKIVDYRNTSGYYYVHSSESDGRMHLKVNVNHAGYHQRMIDNVYLVPIKSGDASQAFLNDSIDMIDPTYYAYASDVENILRNLPNANLHKTLQIGLTSLVFTNAAVKKSSSSGRIAAALAIKYWFLNKTEKIFGGEETDQYFQSFGSGFISSDQRQSLSRRAEHSRGSSSQFVLGLTEKYRPWATNYKFPDFIDVRFYKSYPGFLPDDQKPDIYLLTADSSLDEDISALSYLFSQGIFSLGKREGVDWIQEYMNLPNREMRIERLQELHFNMLETVKVFPILSRPYIAIVRPEYDMDFPQIYAGSPMWKVWKR